MKSYLLLALSVAIICSCNKPEGIPSQSNCSFVNQTNRQITLDLYENKQDYNNEVNRIQRARMAPGEKQQMILEVGKEYWLDWYSDGYTYNNWINSLGFNGQTQPKFKAAAVDDTRLLTATMKDTIRSIVLDGHIATRWVGFATNAGSLNGRHEFVFRKDKTGTYTFNPTGGETQTQDFTYDQRSMSTTGSQINDFSLGINSEGFQQTLFNAMCGVSNSAQYKTGRDSFFVYPNGSSSFYGFGVKRQ
jgi:hypothetical protein